LPLARLTAAPVLAALFLGTHPALIVAQQRPAGPETARSLAQLAPRIPSVVGMLADSAITAMAVTRLPIVRLDSIGSTQQRGRVVAQRPAAGAFVSRTKAETLWIARRALSAGAYVTLPPGVLVPRVGTETPVDDAPAPTDTVVPSAVFAIVPPLYGYTPNLVSAALERARLRPGRAQQDSSDLMPAGRVFRQDPPAGTQVGRGRSVEVWYSLGPHRAPLTTLVPLVEQRTIAEARVVLEKSRLRLGRVTTEYQRDADGRIVHQEPHAGERAHRDDAVDVTISAEPLPISVPSVIGLSRQDARVKIEAAGLEVGGISFVTREGATSTIEAQSPAAGTGVTPRSLIDLVVARAPAITRTNVPNLIGKTQAAAERSLAADSLALGTVVRPTEDAAARIIAQDPPAGRSVALHTRVNVRIAGSVTSPLVRVPRVVNRTVGDAQRTLADSGLSRILISGDSTTATSVVVAQSPLAGTLTQRDALVTLIAEALVGAVVPDLINRRESAASDEARRDNFSMRVASRRRVFRLTELVVAQRPIAGARDRGDHRIDVDLAIPVVPPVPGAIVLALTAVSGATVRRLKRAPKGDEERARERPDTSGPELLIAVDSVSSGIPVLEASGDELIRSSMEFGYELGLSELDVECPSSSTIIASEALVPYA
jgi:beta-lactam-binding protein with PASTA domain